MIIDILNSIYIRKLNFKFDYKRAIYILSIDEKTYNLR